MQDSGDTPMKGADKKSKKRAWRDDKDDDDDSSSASDAGNRYIYSMTIGI